MEKILNEQLIKKYKPLHIPLFIECGNGWYTIIDNMFEEIYQIYKSNKKEVSKLHVLQIKEKFGQLRVYMAGFNDDIEEIINRYEDISKITCEACGEIGDICIKDHWLKTLCPKHLEEYGYEKFNKKDW
jgi:hypothetical protein